MMTFYSRLMKLHFGDSSLSKTKSLFSILLILIFLLGLGSSLNAQTPTPPVLGDGSLANPYQIATLNNLAWLQDPANNSQWSKNFIQTANIDASGTASWNYDGYSATLGFSPIGNDYTNYPFSGTYNGQGHIISGLTINRLYNSYVGLFGYTLPSSSISNLSLINVNITGSFFVGGIVGVAQGIITNCNTSGTVKSLPDWEGDCYYVGGLVGYISGQISDSYSSASVTGNVGAGGLVGTFGGGSINNSYSTGNVTSSGAYAGYLGGLIGYVEQGNISNCHSTGNIISSSGGWYHGGLIGTIRPGTGTPTITVNNCYSTGNISGSYSGGFIGAIDLLGGTPNISVNMCYATGSVSGDNYFNGGLIGEITTACSVNNCYSRGDATNANYAGGLIGYMYPCTLNNC